MLWTCCLTPALEYSTTSSSRPTTPCPDLPTHHLLPTPPIADKAAAARLCLVPPQIRPRHEAPIASAHVDMPWPAHVLTHIDPGTVLERPCVAPVLPTDLPLLLPPAC
mmetsp:Transcript_22955/g.39373  ORF Transcript_22955/g.39373 Transcript_22955/m.39373 type:complete len:108 (-) Transcript_22955:440-763(-)